MDVSIVTVNFPYLKVLEATCIIIHLQYLVQINRMIVYDLDKVVFAHFQQRQ